MHIYLVDNGPVLCIDIYRNVKL